MRRIAIVSTISRIKKGDIKLTMHLAEKYIYDKIAESGVQKDTVIVRGEATPGSTILITWKSVIISSVIVSDASQGKFELEVPKELTTGDHNIITYALDEKTTQ